MGLHLDVQIADQLRQVLIDGDGSFSHTFIPKTPTDLIQLFNASVEPDMIGDNYLTQLRLVHGTDAGPYVKNTSEASRIAQIAAIQTGLHIAKRRPRGSNHLISKWLASSILGQ